jgi:hypothetical protein
MTGSGRPGSGIPASFRARPIRAALCPASRQREHPANDRRGDRIRLQPVRPRQRAALPDIEELRHDPPCPATSVAACSRRRAREATGSW